MSQLYEKRFLYLITEFLAETMAEYWELDSTEQYVVDICFSYEEIVAEYEEILKKYKPK